ncbi:thiamine diphosphokinase [Rhizobium sp. TRM96647]|uniref:thiamine diphosphokinase n=1 Tax=unclassified Rhizobium TaxID=2613769 RepID=UPI0021E7118B|nr:MULTISPECIES: thiamine diphosphokinase [unclassified Rhizobium]MCV3734738.1 thiamine diphosphokinase [Rhizobium sp. TRM96647]MCV3757108.1 thiamine diphosphokinase [Rhizobium sp. TRM96650]
MTVPLTNVPDPLFVVLLGGTLEPTARFRASVAGARFIAADGGMRHATALGITPEVWVGDFDSTTPEDLATWAHVPREPYPAAKNATDGEIAVSVALERGARRLILAGALGGERSDHALMHLLHAVALKEDGLDITLTSGLEEAWPLLAGRTTVSLPDRSLFSVLGLSVLSGLSIENVRYPLSGFDLPFGSSRTVSNVALGPVTFTLAAGRAVLLARPYDHSGA